MWKRCLASAIDRATNRTVYCELAKDHKESHFWQNIEDNQLLSASWYGPDDGLPVMIGQYAEEKC